MGTACSAGICDKEDDRKEKEGGLDHQNTSVEQRVPSGILINIPNIEEEEIDQLFVGEGKDKISTQQSSPDSKRGLVDPDYFSEEELIAYKKLHRTELLDRVCKIGPTPRVWKEGDHIGSGSYGEVVMGLDQANGTLMAVKKVHIQSKKGRSQSKIEALEQEISIYEKLSHKNIVGYLGSELTSNYFNIFLEYVEGGSLLSIINNFDALSENVVKNYTVQILDGLAYLHSHEVIHRDLKAANVLVDRNGICKLADFGTAKSVHELNGQTNTLTGTLNWMAPEVIKQLPYGRAADIWSIGCTVYEMATGHPAWQEAGNAVVDI